MARLRRKGAAVVIATGRQPYAAAGAVTMFAGNVDFLVCANGGSGAFQVAEPGKPASSIPSDWKMVAPANAMSEDQLRTLDELLPKMRAAVPGIELVANFVHEPGAKIRDVGAISSLNLLDALPLPAQLQDAFKQMPAALETHRAKPRGNVQPRLYG